MQRRALLIALIGNRALAQTTLELNEATQAQLESLPGIGPALAERLLAARQQAPFMDWDDLRRRVRGIGAASAGKLSDQGLRIAGRAWAEPLKPASR
jgi:competence protein ComEA